MKTTLLIFLCSIALALGAFGQTPTPGASPSASANSASPSPTLSGANISPSVTASVSSVDTDDISRDVARKLKHKFGITVDRHGPTISRHHSSDGDFDTDEAAWMAVPIVAVIFSTLFGAPVLVVAAIMFFSYLKSRSLHRTVRTMVEKGQEVPAALFAPPPVVRARSDMRRGVVLLMVGFGLMIFFGAVNDWENGAWALGVIPFLIGLGYLLVWKLEGRKDKVPPLP
ncbi:MAG: hypothetical protein DLM73_13580 [Chthoniobacterales bacterium]|nr:MAG: hypothetical protein DLM73_13580 [Chthoniobacterales bacterium]